MGNKKYHIGLYEKAMPSALNWEEKLQCARDCGYDFVEISIDVALYFRNKKLDELADSQKAA